LWEAQLQYLEYEHLLGQTVLLVLSYEVAQEQLELKEVSAQKWNLGSLLYLKHLKLVKKYKSKNSTPYKARWTL
jgi:hypothetical protein